MCCPIVLASVSRCHATITHIERCTTKIASQILKLPILWNSHCFKRHVPRYCCYYASRHTFSKVVHALTMITSFRFWINATCTLFAWRSVSLEKHHHDIHCPPKDSWVARVRFHCTSTASTFIANTTVFAARISIDSSPHTPLNARSHIRRHHALGEHTAPRFCIVQECCCLFLLSLNFFQRSSDSNRPFLMPGRGAERFQMLLLTG